TAKVTMANGSVLTPPVRTTTGAGVVTDANGNQISTPGNGNFIDTLNTPALSISGSAPNDTLYQYTDSNGYPQKVTVKYTPATIHTDFNCNVSQFGDTPAYLISSINYPDGSAYQFTYERSFPTATTYTGRLLTIALPSGGTI